MAKRKKAAESPSVDLDEVFAKATKAVEAKMLKAGMLVGHQALQIVLPVPAFSVRYLLQNEGLPLSCVYQIVGPEASYKSTAAAEFLRWHRLCGGGGMLSEAETKPTAEMRNAVLNWDAGAVKVLSCLSMNDWQKHASWYVEVLKKAFSKADGPGPTIPWCHIVDTITGKVSEETLKTMDASGSAGRHFPLEAMFVADFMRAHPQRMLGWPFTFVGVNHMKIRDKDGQIEKHIPGGWALRFQCAMIIEMERMGQIQEFNNYCAARIRMQTLKNSYGRDNMRLYVRFKTWYQEDAPGVNRLHSRFEWWEASILLLAKGLGMTKATAEKWVPRFKEVCDIHEKSGGSRGTLYWSKRLDVPSSEPMTAHDLGVRLEHHPDVLADLYALTGVQRHPFFKPGVDHLKQVEEYAYVLAQADAADDHQKRLEQIRDQQVNVDPATVDVAPPTDVAEDTGPMQTITRDPEVL